MLRQLFVFYYVLAVVVVAFDKRQWMKGKYTQEKQPQFPHSDDDGLGNENSKHPISRRVLRWERSAEPLFEPDADFPLPTDLQVLPSDLDFVKVRPHLPAKTKPSLTNNEVDYDPAVEF
ncbi:unnamed protein product, partial [Mesorhabditis spiculigera]